MKLTTLFFPSLSFQTTSIATGTVVASNQKYYVGIWDGLKWNLKHHGVIGGLFRGVGPRVFWTSLQSAIMFVFYEQAIHLQENMRHFGHYPYASS